MLDLSVPFYPVIMVCHRPPRPEPSLPEGLCLKFWEPGLEEDWCRIHMAAGQLATMEEALGVFRREFAPYPKELQRRMLLLYGAGGRAIATAALWFGGDLGRPAQRFHWLSCVPERQGEGLGKLMVELSLELYHELGRSDTLYLTTQTTSYAAIGIYKKYGFAPYLGPMPHNGMAWDNEAAWAIIGEKLAQYRR